MLVANSKTLPIDFGQDWVYSEPCVLELTESQHDLSISELLRAFQNHHGLVIKNSQPVSINLPPASLMLEMFKNMVNRPLVDGDLFILNIKSVENVYSIIPSGFVSMVYSANIPVYGGEYRFVINNLYGQIILFDFVSVA